MPIVPHTWTTDEVTRPGGMTAAKFNTYIRDNLATALVSGGIIQRAVFTVAGTYDWVMPTTATMVDFFVMAAGGGGSSGQVTPSGNAARGGSGGGGGGYTWLRLDATRIDNSTHSYLTTVTVGAGGTGGAASTGTNNVGGDGGHSSVAMDFPFTIDIYAEQGFGGQQLTGGVGGFGLWWGSPGATQGGGAKSLSLARGGLLNGGPDGGDISAGNVVNNNIGWVSHGNSGRIGLEYGNSTLLPWQGISPTPGVSPNASGLASLTVDGADGTVGFGPGAGGGGGGAARTGHSAGAGGNGFDGAVWIVTFG